MSQPSQPPLELAWQTLRASLEWAHEFALVFVFCSDTATKEALFRRADDLMRAQVRPFERPASRQSTDFIQTLLPFAVRPSSVHLASNMPLWLDLDSHPGNAEWDAARAEFLNRLNERRASLVREHTRAVVLALPQDWTKRAAEAAPDLWTIRQPTVYLGRTAQFGETADRLGDETRLTLQTVQASAATPKELPLAVRRWQTAREAHSAMDGLTVWDGVQASQAALEAGHTTLALDIAHQTTALAQENLERDGKTPERLRDLSVSMNKLGDVAQALGQLEDAKTAYAQGEQLSRALIDDFGKTPERLRDLSVSMERLGDVARALGQLEDAKTAYAQGEQLRRALIDDFGKTPERVRDLSVSMDRLGDVAQALGQLEDAKTAYAQGEGLATELIDTYGETVLGLETLAYNAFRLGQVLEKLGETVAAQPHLSKARSLYQRLTLAMPHEQRYRNLLEELGVNVPVLAQDTQRG